MKVISRSLLRAVASTVFAFGAFATAGSQENPQDPGDGACCGGDLTCPASCVTVCDPKDPDDCVVRCSFKEA